MQTMATYNYGRVENVDGACLGLNCRSMSPAKFLEIFGF